MYHFYIYHLYNTVLLPDSLFVNRSSSTKHLLREVIRPFSPSRIVDRSDKVGFAPNAIDRAQLLTHLLPTLKPSLHSLFLDDYKKLCFLNDRNSGATIQFCTSLTSLMNNTVLLISPLISPQIYGNQSF